MKYLQPHDYQQEAIDFITSREGSMLMLDCGLGKTAISLMAMRELISDMAIKGVLVVAPLRPARMTWPLEIMEWEQTHWMPWTLVHGSKKRRERRLWGPEKLFYLINYEGLSWLSKELKMKPREEWPFDAIVWDESTKMKSPTSKRFKAWKDLIYHFKYRVGLTGTPSPKSLMDLWSQIYCVDNGLSLGQSFYRFRGRFFRKADYFGHKYELVKGGDKTIHNLIKDVCLRMSAEDHLDIPPCTITDVDVQLNSYSKQYQELEKDLWTQLDSGESVGALSVAAALGKCRQYVGGAVYLPDELGAPTQEWVEIHQEKVNALKKLVKEHEGEPMLVAYGFTHEKERLCAAFPQMEFLGGGMSAEEEQDLQERWNRGEVPLLGCHPASAGHGLNFQYGGRIAVWFTMDWSLELYQQFNKRIDRQGQTKSTTIYRLVMQDTVDEVVATALERKDGSQKALLNAMQRYRTRKE